MARPKSLPLRSVQLLLSCLLFATTDPRLRAQDPAGEADHPYTLHVYEDLIELPALVLNSVHGTYPGLTESEFALRLDSGPTFHPLRVRLQGDDPMQLALILDNTGQVGEELTQQLAAYTPNLPATLLRSTDLLSVLEADCSWTRAVRPKPASIERLVSDITAVVPQVDRSQKSAIACGGSAPLWNFVASTVTKMQGTSGRKVIVVLTSREGDKNDKNWEAIRHYAVRNGVTVIGLQIRSSNWGALGGGGLRLSSDHEDPLGILCSGTGGLFLNASPATVWPQFRRVLELLRERYILDFHRPVNDSGGLHQIDLAVKDRKALVRISGTSVPLRDQELLRDPSTVPSDTSHDPVYGDRKILTKPH